jgi:hypothetical protein
LGFFEPGLTATATFSKGIGSLSQTFHNQFAASFRVFGVISIFFIWKNSMREKREANANAAYAPINAFLLGGGGCGQPRGILTFLKFC